VAKVAETAREDAPLHLEDKMERTLQATSRQIQQESISWKEMEALAGFRGSVPSSTA
jgi:hypothetical protein